MAGASDRGGLARFVDDYVEEVAVGRPWWVLVAVFGLAMPAVMWIVGLIFGFRYKPGTYVIAVFIGVGIALVLRLIARERERYRYGTLDRSRDLQGLRRLSSTDFEIAVGQLVRQQGYIVKERGGLNADGGIDLIAEGHKGRIAIQCKRWTVWPVSAPAVRELYGTVKKGGFTGGWLVTSGVFTASARSWSRGTDLRLIDGRDLADLLKGTSMVKPQSATEPTGQQAADVQFAECPNCAGVLRRMSNADDGSLYWGGSEHTCEWTFNDAPSKVGEVLCDRGHRMVQRLTKRGVSFWGCSRYPSCQRKRLARVGLIGALER